VPRPGHPLDALLAARGTLFPWVPVLMACGIGLWFAAAREPGVAAYAAAAAAGLAGAALGRLGAERWRPVGVALACVALGFLAAGLRSERVAAPVLEFRYYGPIEGRIVGIDRSQADRLRLTLDRVVLADVAPARVPRQVRVALHGPQGIVDPVPGTRVMLTGHLAAPEGPVEPGGFDFRRMAWFRGLGAVGYTRTPVVLAAPPEDGAVPVTRLRLRIAEAVRAALPGEPGAFAAAILTGDRSGIGQPTLQDLRDSNLAHLLAISGLHMGLLTGFVFAALRTGLALVPPLALRVPTKKVAAALALVAAAFYLALSGGNVATERAFVMVAVMLGAILADRRALSLRSVAIAAVLILLVQPEALTEAGFQMSFAATVALVAGFAALRVGRSPDAPGRLPRALRPLGILFASSLLAGLATAPIAAAHFNRMAEYGLLANLLAVPLMGSVIIPAAVVAGLLAPLGLAAPALWCMEQGTRWILWVADRVAALEGAVTPVVAPAGWVLPVMALGALWLVLWRGWIRLAGLVPVAAALLLWSGPGRPALLVSADGGLVGVMGAGGRVLSAPRGNGFTAEVWLENDADPVAQAVAAGRPGFSGPRGDRRFAHGGIGFAQLSGKGAAARVPAACREAAVVILAARLEGPVPEGCTVIDRALLARTGALALSVAPPGGAAPVVLHASDAAVRRWSPRAVRAAASGGGQAVAALAGGQGGGP
jgi:competence protein ComEC